MIQRFTKTLQNKPAKLLYIVLSFFLLNIIANPLFAQHEFEEGKQFHQEIFQDQDKISVHIKESVTDIINGEPVEIEGQFIFSKTILPEFYKNRNYMPAWRNWGTLVDAKNALEASYEDGLNPDDYHMSVMVVIIEKIE